MKEEGKTRTVRRHERAVEVLQTVNAVVKYLELSYSNNQVYQRSCITESYSQAWRGNLTPLAVGFPAQNGLAQLPRPGSGAAARAAVPAAAGCEGAAGPACREQQVPAREVTGCNVRCGKHLVKIKQKGRTHEPGIKCLHLISEEEHVGQMIHWGFEPTVPWSAGTFYWHQYQRHEGQEKYSVVCASLLHPIPPFCDVLKGEVLHWLSERFDAVSIMLSFKFRSDRHCANCLW